MSSLSFDKLAWAAVLYHSTTSDEVSDTLSYTKLVDLLEAVPSDVNGETLKCLVEYLNRWGNCRIPDEKSRKLRTELKQIPADLHMLPLLEVAFSSVTEADESVAQAYRCLRNAVGPTAVSKVLHLIAPGSLMMWDDAIRQDQLPQLRAVENADGYVKFLGKMRIMARNVTSDFETSHGSNEPASYLSEKLGLLPPLSLAKFIDEYNWLTITKQAKVPPIWHPGHD